MAMTESSVNDIVIIFSDLVKINDDLFKLFRQTHGPFRNPRPIP